MRRASIRPQMWIARSALGAVALACAILGACSERDTVLTARATIPDLAGLAGLEIDDHERPARRDERREEKQRRGDAPVFVDGDMVGVLRYAELPPHLATTFQRLDDGRLVRRFAWRDYLVALGVDVAAIQAVHFYGGRTSVSVVAGDELRRLEDRLRFSFTQSSVGKPRMEYPADERTETNRQIDLLGAVAIYVRKPAPRYHNGEMRLPDGRLVVGIPYSDTSEAHGGTRVYVDGAFRGSVRRRALSAKMLIEAGVPASGYSLGRTLEAMGVALADVKRAQLVGRHDDVLADWRDGEVRARIEPASFKLAENSRGRVVIAGVGEAGGEPLGAIVLYAKRVPADRSIPAPAAAASASARGGVAAASAGALDKP
jgi:hypothetical protein